MKAAHIARYMGGLDLLGLADVGREDPPPIDGFKCFLGKPRPNRSPLGAGKGQGLAAYVCNRLAAYCKIVKSDDYIMWLQFSIPQRGAFFVGITYLPPANSVAEWGNDDGWLEAFASIEHDIKQFKKQGEILILGDFNAHTGTWDDTGSDSQSVLDAMGVLSGDMVSGHPLARRNNSDVQPVCSFGKALINLCVATQCVISNGRAPGDERGMATRPSQQPGRPGSVIDYGLISRGWFPKVSTFEVQQSAIGLSISDHLPVLCVLDLPDPPADGGGGNGQKGHSKGVLVECIRWNPDKREEYNMQLRMDECVAQRAAVISALQSGELSPAEACEKWCLLVHNVAKSVFGVCSAGGVRAPNGRRLAKRWFKHCKPEWQRIQEAVKRGDTHAAAEARKAFNAAKRRAKRYCEKQWHKQLLRDLKVNPRKFWTAYNNRKASHAPHDLDTVDSHWRSLYGSPGQCSLPECGSSVAEFVNKLMVECPLAPHAHDAGLLNESFSVEEVEAVLLKMHNGRMAGPDGFRGELFKGAYEEIPVEDGKVKHDFTLSEDLSVLLSAVFKSGCVPPVWCSALLTAVFKKGDMNDLDNYRGIAVGSVMGKMLSMLLDARLSSYCEQHGYRAEGQAGFRHNRRTSDHVFVLKHLIDKHRLNGSHLFVCFVDFRKAYDLVRRDLLMRCLREIGLHGSMLETIVSMYWDAPMATKLGGQVGQPFASTRGVKQGDPLSPLLFGIFFDRIEKWFEQHARSCGVELAGQLVRMLLYADDLALVAQSAAHLQLMLKALQSFCAEYDMEVNVQKSEIVVFGRSRFKPSPEGWQYNGHTIPVSSEFRYLGIVFHETKGVSVCIDALCTAGRRAMWAMLSRCTEHNIHSMSMKVHLFNTLVSPILTYCSEVWGPSLLQRSGQGQQLISAVLDNDLCRLQMLCLRMIAGKLRKSTNRQLLMRELGCRPLAFYWLRGMLGMWNRLTSQNPPKLLHLAMRENIQLYLSATDSALKKQLWFYKFRGVLTYLHAHTNELSETLQQADNMQQLTVAAVLKAFDTWFYQQWQDLPTDPRGASSDQVQYCTYEKWFADCPFTELDMHNPTSWCPNFVHDASGINQAHVASLLRFRLGAHDLRVVTGRWSQDRNVRENRVARVCELCHTGITEDEFHMVFECPFYAPAREYFACLFSDGAANWENMASSARPDGPDMARFMAQNVKLVAAFVHVCWLLRRDPDLDPHVVLSAPSVQHVLESSELLPSSDGNPSDDVIESYVESSLQYPMSLPVAPKGLSQLKEALKRVLSWFRL